MKFFLISTVLLALAAFAQTGAVGTPTGTGAGSGVGVGNTTGFVPGAPINSGVTTVAPGLGSTTVGPNPEALNPSVNPVPNLNQDGSVFNNTTLGPLIPDPNVRQSQEEAPTPVLPSQPSAFPPVNNPGQPANVDMNGRPIIP